MRELTAADIYANTCEFAQASAESDLRRIAKFVIDHGGKIPPVEFYEKPVPTIRELMAEHGIPFPSEEQQQRNLEMNLPELSRASFE